MTERERVTHNDDFKWNVERERVERDIDYSELMIFCLERERESMRENEREIYTAAFPELTDLCCNYLVRWISPQTQTIINTNRKINTKLREF